jgi:N-methylhydantoinase B
MSVPSPQGDPPARGRAGVQMALLASRLDTIVRKMANTLYRTARSGVLNSGHDFSCAILTRDCRLLTAAESLPIHVMIGPDLMCRAVMDAHPQLAPGDAFLHNSPYHGNSHPADQCIIIPLIDGGVHRFWLLCKAHQADCGNSEPTTYMGHARDVYQEGALIFPGVRVQRDYTDIGDIIRMCMSRIRVPEQWWGDYLAALGAARIGERELLSLGREVGWDTLEQHGEAWFDYAEARMARAIRRLPGGTIEVATRHDPFPGVPEGIALKIGVAIDAATGRVTVDLRDNPDCQPCGLNLSPACALSTAMIGVYNGIADHTVPPNAGSFRRVEVLIREGCVLGARHPYSCSVATTNLADRVTSGVQRAIAEIAPGFGMAEGAPIFPPAGGVISGNDPRRRDEPFVNQVHLGLTGGAGAPGTDGWLTIVHVGNGGICRHDCIEVDELHHPIRIRERRIVTDSEGAGQFRGAPAVRVELGPIDGCRMRIFYTADGTISPALGARGGLPGGRIQAIKRTRSGEEIPQPSCAGVALEPGETIISVSAGGGGYGSPLARDPDRVAHDVAEGWISPGRATDVYGVVLDGERVDLAATQAHRAAMQEEEGDGPGRA